MASFNRVILLGNLTRDPVMRYTPSGSAVCELGIAVSKQWFDKETNQKKEKTAFVDVTFWGRTAEIANEYLKKGKPVHIEGELTLDQWDDKETGAKRSKLKVTGQSLQLIGSRDPADQRPANNPDGYGEEPQVRPDPEFASDKAQSGNPTPDEVPF